MVRRLMLLAPLVLAGCSGNGSTGLLEAGEVHVCLGIPGWMDDDVRVRYSGTLGQSPAGAECYGEPAHGLRIETADGPVDITYAVYDATDADVTPSLDLTPGQAIDVLAVHGVTWGTDTGFVVYDKDGLVAAFEPGFQGAEPRAEHLEGLVIERGADTAARRNETCGVQRGQMLDVTGQATLSLANGRIGQVLTSSGTAVNVMNVATYEYESLDCTDTWGPKAWAVWR